MRIKNNGKALAKRVITLEYQKQQKPKSVYFLDIETAPTEGLVWGKYDQTVAAVKQDWFILSYAVKQLGSRNTECRGLPDYPGYKANRIDDKALMTDLWHFLNSTEIVVAHNGDRFDFPKINSRFLVHKMPVPMQHSTVDTLKIARGKFRFDSNKLDDLAQILGIGRKVPTPGIRLWQDCMDGDMKAWEVMKTYNCHDVELLEQVYLQMRPWATKHPSVTQAEGTCPKCGSINVQQDGWTYTRTRMKPRYQCKSCSGWFAGSAMAKGDVA